MKSWSSPADPSLAMTTAFWHFARGSAAAAKGQIGIAERERRTLEAARRTTPKDMEFSMYSNKAQTFLDLAGSILDARLATAQGDRERAITYWENAVRIQDTLYYGEPPEWFYPVRESLGSALLLNGQADQAKQCFAPTWNNTLGIPVAVWTFEEFRSPEEDRQRGMGSARICNCLEERGHALEIGISRPSHPISETMGLVVLGVTGRNAFGPDELRV